MKTHQPPGLRAGLGPGLRGAPEAAADTKWPSLSMLVTVFPQRQVAIISQGCWEFTITG